MAANLATAGEAAPPRTGSAPEGGVRVLLVDERGLFADALSDLLAGEARIQVVGTARDGDEAAALAALLRPAVVVMDRDLPTRAGVEASWVIQETLPSVYVVMLSGSKLVGDIDLAHEDGADPRLLRECVSAELLNTVFEICSSADPTTSAGSRGSIP